MSRRDRWWWGEEWRWEPGKHPSAAPRSIQVIEQAAGAARVKDGRRVPFGFGRVLEPEGDPMTQADWEGDGA